MDLKSQLFPLKLLCDTPHGKFWLSNLCRYHPLPLFSWAYWGPRQRISRDLGSNPSLTWVKWTWSLWFFLQSFHVVVHRENLRLTNSSRLELPPLTYWLSLLLPTTLDVHLVNEVRAWASYELLTYSLVSLVSRRSDQADLHCDQQAVLFYLLENGVELRADESRDVLEHITAEGFRYLLSWRC